MKKIIEFIVTFLYLIWYDIVLIACTATFSIISFSAIVYLNQINSMGNLFADFLFYCVIVASVVISHLIAKYTFDK